MVVVAVLATAPALFWVAAVIAGLCMGSSQSAGRALVACSRRRPGAPSSSACGRWPRALAAIVGPVTYGLVTWLTGGNHRLAILSTGRLLRARAGAAGAGGRGARHARGERLPPRWQAFRRESGGVRRWTGDAVPG